MSLTHNKKIIRDFSRAATSYDTYAVLQRKVADQLFLNCRAELGALDSGDALPITNHQSPITQNILDIGCGTGYFHELLRKNKIYLPLVQLDISHAMCLVAASYASSPPYGGTYTCSADMHSLPFAGGSFANIFSSMTMQWSGNLKRVFSEAARVLQNKGGFAFSIVADGSLFELRDVFLEAGENPRIHNFITQAELEVLLKNCGFTEYEINTETITIFYKDIYAALLSIKAVGASYKGVSNSGIKGKNYFTKLGEIYRDKFMQNEGLPLSWNIIYVKGRK